MSEKRMFAFRHIRTRLWWAKISGPDTDELAEAALFATKVKGATLQPDTMYEPVPIQVTLEEESE